MMAVGLEHKRVNTIFIAPNEFFERDEIPALALPGQIFVGH
jgi:hypothetical protein